MSGLWPLGSLVGGCAGVGYEGFGCEFWRELLDHLDDRLDVLYGRARYYAVAEVEDVAGASGGLSEDLLDAGFEDRFWGEERDRIKIALDGACVVHLAPGFVERRAPVEADDVGAGFTHGWEQAGGVYAEVDDWNAHLLDGAD